MIRRIFLTPIQKFVQTGSLAGTLLFGAAIVALVWANSSYGSYYEQLWQYKLGISFQDFELKKSLSFWINDGLMAIFFFLIGLELKREMTVGEINSVKKATFPILAALGGVIVPIGLYLLLNENPETVKGWGIPMATDIAFALAILSALGKRVPLSLKIFLTAFAIIDDIAAVVVIAVFYSAVINWLFILYAFILLAILGLLYYKTKYTFAIGILIAVAVWFLFLKSGIHPTIAGVLLAFTIPIKRRLDVLEFSSELKSISVDLDTTAGKSEQRLLSPQEMGRLDDLEDMVLEVRSPLQHLEHKLHSMIAYFILPVFALANSGVVISRSYDFDMSLMFNIAASLLIGKFLGVVLFSFLGVKLKLAELPRGINFKHIIGVAAIAGVGFTMAIFMANLAFDGDNRAINSVKVGIIIGSLISGIIGYTILRLTTTKSEA